MESSRYVIDFDNINDILQEVVDIGYKFQIETRFNSDDESINHIDISIWKRPGYIYTDEIIDTVGRLVDFLRRGGWEMTNKSKSILKSFSEIPHIEKGESDYKTIRVGSMETFDIEWIDGKWGIWNDLKLEFYTP